MLWDFVELVDGVVDLEVELNRIICRQGLDKIIMFLAFRKLGFVYNNNYGDFSGNLSGSG